MAFEKQRFILINPHVRQNAMRAVHTAPDGWSVTVAPATRSLDQNAKFHAICSDLARSDLQWAGRRRDADVRESTARMSVHRASSLIEYAIAFCVSHGVDLKETISRGFLDAVRRAA